jgi:hypothetical protein
LLDTSYTLFIKYRARKEVKNQELYLARAYIHLLKKNCPKKRRDMIAGFFEKSLMENQETVISSLVLSYLFKSIYRYEDAQQYAKAVLLTPRLDSQVYALATELLETAKAGVEKGKLTSNLPQKPASPDLPDPRLEQNGNGDIRAKAGVNLSGFSAPSSLSIPDVQTPAVRDNLLDSHVTSDAKAKARMETSTVPTQESEKVHVYMLEDIPKCIPEADLNQPITIALGTSSMAGYSPDKKDKYDDLNGLMRDLRRMFGRYKNIDFVDQRAGESDTDFAKRIDAGDGRRIVVLTDLDTLIAENSAYASLRNRDNVFLAGVPYKDAGFDEDSYLPIVELLREATRLGLNITEIPANSNIAVTPYERYKNVFSLLPKTKPYKPGDYNKIHVLFAAQHSA